MMRKGCLLLVLVLAGPGCLSPGTHVETEARKTPPVQLAEPAAPPPVVTADQVTESNAVEKAQAVAREMDAEAASLSAAAPVAVTMNGPTKP